tara:strand:- start:201 stop:350 length:150 start_codon:yes stop_codon:yes gene_type:complete
MCFNLFSIFSLGLKLGGVFGQKLSKDKDFFIIGESSCDGVASGLAVGVC